MYISRYLNSNAFTPVASADELTKVLTAHKHVIGVGIEYFPPAARSPVNFVRAQLEEAKN